MNRICNLEEDFSALIWIIGSQIWDRSKQIRRASIRLRSCCWRSVDHIFREISVVWRCFWSLRVIRRNKWMYLGIWRLSWSKWISCRDVGWIQFLLKKVELAHIVKDRLFCDMFFVLLLQIKLSFHNPKLFGYML